MLRLRSSDSLDVLLGLEAVEVGTTPVHACITKTCAVLSCARFGADWTSTFKSCMRIRHGFFHMSRFLVVFWCMAVFPVGVSVALGKDCPQLGAGWLLLNQPGGRSGAYGYGHAVNRPGQAMAMFMASLGLWFDSCTPLRNIWV
jgi:hypothetical protein